MLIYKKKKISKKSTIKVYGELLKKQPKDNENHQFWIKDLLERILIFFEKIYVSKDFLSPSSGIKRINGGKFSILSPCA